MFQYLAEAGIALHQEMVKIYWILFVPLVLFLLVLEILKEEGPNLKSLLRRIFISVILLVTFNFTIDCIANLGDAITDRIHGLEKFTEVLSQLGPKPKGSNSLFNLRENILYVFSLAAYLIAYIGFFFANAITHFVWTILYVMSPLMILMYVSPSTSHITNSLYKGLAQVAVWKVFYAVLGVLLLKIATTPQDTGMDDYIMSVVINLCIGISMLFIPIATKSLLNDGMSSMANSLSLVPAMVAGGVTKLAIAKFAKKGALGTVGAGSFLSSPLKNKMQPRVQKIKDQVVPRFQNMKHSYKKLGMNETQIKKYNRNHNIKKEEANDLDTEKSTNG